MFHNLAEDIVFLLITHKIVDINERDVYAYGLEVILLNGSLFIVCLIISLLCGEMMNFLTYLIFFVPLRIFTGGYHAKTSEKCFVISTLMYGASIAAVKIFPLLYQRWEGRAAGLISALVILVMAPLINENNPLNQHQKKRNRIIAYSILVVDLVFFIFCCKNNWQVATNELIFIIFTALLLLIGKVSPYLDEDDGFSQ